MQTFREKIKQTFYFKLLNGMQRTAVLSKTNIRHINAARKEIKKVGIDKWKETTTFNEMNQTLLTEFFYPNKNKRHETNN